MAPIELDTVHYNARMAMIYDAWTVSGLQGEKTRQFASASAVPSTRSECRSHDAEERVQGVFEPSTRVENGGNVRRLEGCFASYPAFEDSADISFGQTAADYEEYNSLSNLDALLLIAGDHTEDDAPKKTSAVQVRCERATPLMLKPLIEYRSRRGYWAMNFLRLSY